MSGKKSLQKTIAGIIALAVVAGGIGLNTAVAGRSSSVVSAAVLGDIDSSGTVDAKDISLIQNYLAGKGSLPDGASADLNGDNEVNVFDLVSLKRIAISASVSDANYIHLNETYISVEGEGMELSSENKVVTITSGGTYYIDGTLSDGQIYVNASDTDTVSLVLNGVDVTCSTNAPVCVVNAGETIINLADGTENVLNDTETYTDAEADSTIYSKDDLTINGSGTLTVNSNYLYSITSNDNLRINAGNITVNHNSVDSSGAAVKGKESVVIRGGKLKVTCAADDTDTGADGIISNSETGYVSVTGGTVNVNAKGGDAIKSKKGYVSITGGKVTAKADKDSVQAETYISIGGTAEVYAYGKRSLTTGEGYNAEITGGSVVATSNEEFTNTAGIKVDSMLLNYSEKIDKQEISVKKDGTEVVSATPDKKYTYALICNSALADGKYTVYTGGAQMTHDGAATAGEFSKSGTVGTFNNVTAMTETPVTEANTITLSNSGITVSGSGASVSADLKTVTISEPGTYIVTGEMEEGQIVVNVDKTTYADGLVELSLEGMSLTNTSTSPVYIEAVGDKCSISAKKGTVNTISDGTSYTNADSGVGAIYARDDITFKGKGTLNVNGNCEDAIVCKNDIRINNGNLNVTAADDGIRGKDSVRIGNPDDTDYSGLNVTVNAKGGDGIKSTETDTTSGKGYVEVNGGTVNITAYSDGIQASQLLTVNDGDITIKTTAPQSSSGGSDQPGGGGWGGGSWGGNSGSTTSDDTSAKGLKAGCTDDETSATIEGTINILGGIFDIDSTDDSVHATNVNVTGGNLKLSSGDDAIHADTALVVGTEGKETDYSTPYIDVIKSYEGLEGSSITQYSGTVMVTSSDDGYNAAGGSDSSGTQGPGGWGQGGSMSGDYSLVINGGYTYVNAGGDGLDSNGTLTVNGGYVFVSQTGGGNSPIDCDSTWNYNGGVVVAGGSSDMFSESIPAKYSFLTTDSISAGSTVTFADSNGSVIATMTFANASQEMVMCSSESSVTCYSGGTVIGAEYFSVSSANENMKAGYGGTISGGTTLSSSSGGGNQRPGGWG